MEKLILKLKRTRKTIRGLKKFIEDNTFDELLTYGAKEKEFQGLRVRICKTVLDNEYCIKVFIKKGIYKEIHFKKQDNKNIITFAMAHYGYRTLTENEEGKIMLLNSLKYTKRELKNKF